MKTAKTSGGSQCQVPYNHRTIKTPFQQKLSRCFGKRGFSTMVFEGSVNYVTQPSGPLFQCVLLLKCRFEIVLQLLDNGSVALTDPGRLFLFFIYFLL